MLCSTNSRSCLARSYVEPLHAFASCKAHNSVQDVLRLRDVPAPPSREISELPETRAPPPQNIVQEMEALAPDTVGGREPSDNRNHTAFTSKPLSEQGGQASWTRRLPLGFRLLCNLLADFRNA